MEDSPEPETRPILSSWVIARIDEIHAAAMRWRDELIAAAEKPDTAQAVAGQLARMPQIEAAMTSVFANLRKLRAPDPVKLTERDSKQVEEDEWIAGSLIDFELIWEKIKNVWPPHAKKPAQAIAKMKECADYLDEIVFICKQRTLTPDINDMLKNVEVGHALDLDFVFDAEFPTNPERRRLLMLEVFQERDVLKSAFVDPERCLVYRLPPKQGRWKRNLLAPFIVLIMFGVVATLPAGRALYESWPFSPEERYRIIGGYALWLLGAFAHVLVQMLRQWRTPTVPAFAVMDGWLLWMNVKQRSICLGILWISVGFFLLICLSHNLDWKTMLLAGYSSDSLTDLFVQRFEQAADTAKKTILSNITPKCEPAAQA